MAIKGAAFRLSRQLLTLAGADATGITPTVRVKTDAGAWAAAANAPSEPDAVNDPGAFEIVLDAGEMAGDQIQVVFREASIATVLTTIDTVDPAAFQADVSNLDVAVSTRAAAATTEQIGTPYTWTNQAGDTHEVTKTAVP